MKIKQLLKKYFNKKEMELHLNSSEFKKIISKEIAPFLRKNGWLGSGFNYYKENKNNTTYVLSFQANRYGGSFCIEIGIHFNFIKIPLLNEISKIKTYHTEINRRLTPNKEDEDYWWGYPKKESEITSLVDDIKKTYSNSGSYFFNQFNNWEEKIPKISIEDIEKKLLNIPFNTNTKAALVLSKINLHLKNYLKAKTIAEYGISTINPPNGELLLPEFHDIVKKSEQNINN